jgi:hypothetical protein
LAAPQLLHLLLLLRLLLHLLTALHFHLLALHLPLALHLLLTLHLPLALHLLLALHALLPHLLTHLLRVRLIDVGWSLASFGFDDGLAPRHHLVGLSALASGLCGFSRINRRPYRRNLRALRYRERRPDRRRLLRKREGGEPSRTASEPKSRLCDRIVHGGSSSECPMIRANAAGLPPFDHRLSHATSHCHRL